MSAICAAIRDHLEVVPPIFDGCSKVITRDDEEAARDAYWRVIIKEEHLAIEEQIATLTLASELNPFVGEPLLMLAQIYFRIGNYSAAHAHATRSLNCMYALASAWDKRRSFPAWIGFARLLSLRAVRKMKAQPHLPISHSLPPTSGGLPLISLHEIMKEMAAY